MSGKRKKININASIIRCVGRPDDNTSISSFSLSPSGFPIPPMTLKINQWHIKLMNKTTTMEIGRLLLMLLLAGLSPQLSVSFWMRLFVCYQCLIKYILNWKCFLYTRVSLYALAETSTFSFRSRVIVR